MKIALRVGHRDVLCLQPVEISGTGGDDVCLQPFNMSSDHVAYECDV